MESYSSYLVTLLPTHTRKDYLNLNNHTEMIGKKEKKLKVTKIRWKFLKFDDHFLLLKNYRRL